MARAGSCGLNRPGRCLPLATCGLSVSDAPKVRKASKVRS